MAKLYSIVPAWNALGPATTTLLGQKVPWRFGSTPLQALLDRYESASLAAGYFLGSKDLFSVAAHEAAIVNRAMKNAGFETSLDDLGSGPNCMYVASMMKLQRNFRIAGQDGYYLPKIGKPGFRLGREAGVLHYKYLGKRVVVVPAAPTTWGNLSMIVADFGDLGWGGIDFWEEVIGSMTPVEGNGLILPLVHVPETQTDVSELVGMTGGDWVILQALLANIFNLTPEGFDLLSLFAYSAGKGAMERLFKQKGDYEADHDFSFAIVGEHQPGFSVAWGHVPAKEI